MMAAGGAAQQGAMALDAPPPSRPIWWPWAGRHLGQECVNLYHWKGFLNPCFRVYRLHLDLLAFTFCIIALLAPPDSIAPLGGFSSPLENMLNPLTLRLSRGLSVGEAMRNNVAHSLYSSLLVARKCRRVLCACPGQAPCSTQILSQVGRNHMRLRRAPQDCKLRLLLLPTHTAGHVQWPSSALRLSTAAGTRRQPRGTFATTAATAAHGSNGQVDARSVSLSLSSTARPSAYAALGREGLELLAAAKMRCGGCGAKVRSLTAGWPEGWSDGQMDRRMVRQSDGQEEECLGRQAFRQTY